MRQTIIDIEINMAYLFELYDSVPHFSSFGKNYTRRFKDTDLFEQIFQHILEECYRFKLVDSTPVFVDVTHVKAIANNKKCRGTSLIRKLYSIEKIFRKEINIDRAEHGKNLQRIRMTIINRELIVEIN